MLIINSQIPLIALEMAMTKKYDKKETQKKKKSIILLIKKDFFQKWNKNYHMNVHSIFKNIFGKKNLNVCNN